MRGVGVVSQIMTQYDRGGVQNSVGQLATKTKSIWFGLLINGQFFIYFCLVKSKQNVFSLVY